MTPTSRSEIQVAPHVRRALDEGAPVVALESTVIAHGLPHPLNVETALACERNVRQWGATPATIGVVEGVATIGLSEDEISVFASGLPGDDRIEKVGLNNLAGAIVKRRWGATTVASSLMLAHTAGIRVLATGGIGGVHRGAAESFDISADLSALANSPLFCVCAGAKAILDLPKTVEYLETLGVPIIGYETVEFPAFYSRNSGLPVNLRVDTPEEAAEVAECHWRIGNRTAVLVCVPVPDQFELPYAEIAASADQAMAQASQQEISGQALTPFLLSELAKLTGGKTLEANRALLLNNASVAARIAVAYGEGHEPV